MLNVLFLCTGNSCRSVMAEGLLNHYGAGRIKAVSAGSHPTGTVNPMSLATFKAHGMKTEGYSSKSWDAFAGRPMDAVITVCDNAAGEACPLFFGAPVKAHWGVPDPAHFEGTDTQKQTEFNRVFGILERRVKALLHLPIEKMGKEEFQQKLNEIGKMDNTIQAHEDKASDFMWPYIQEHVNYLSAVYGLCFEMQHSLDGKELKSFSNTFRAQMMVLMRVSDFIRCIQLLGVKCYPEQAGTLAASIYELVQTGIYFSNNDAAAKKWLSSDNVKAWMPEAIMPEEAKRHEKNWKELTKINYEAHKKSSDSSASKDEDFEREYEVYKQLCWMKHSLPKMQNMIVEAEGVRFQFGPYTDERAQNHLLYVLLNAGRLTEMLIHEIITLHPYLENFTNVLTAISQKRAALWNAAKSKYDDIANPFINRNKAV